MKILLLGKNGQVGWELQRSLAPLGELLALDRHSTTYCGDLTRLEGLADTVRLFKPNVVVNAAAYTAVDKAESDSETAIQPTTSLMAVAKRLGARPMPRVRSTPMAAASWPVNRALPSKVPRM
jgi:dTDP-4-dehydrorhamnose reductase